MTVKQQLLLHTVLHCSEHVTMIEDALLSKALCWSAFHLFFKPDAKSPPVLGLPTKQMWDTECHSALGDTANAHAAVQ